MRLEKLYNYFLVHRPPLLFLGLIASAALTHHYSINNALFVVLTIFFYNAGFTIMNEIRDVNVDAFSKKKKVVARKEVSRGVGIALVLIYFFLASIFASILIISNKVYLFLVAVAFIFSLVYNGFQKRNLVGNCCLGGAYGIAAYMSSFDIYFALSFFFWTFGFNVAQQIQDYNIDKKALLKTVPQEMGIFQSKALSLFLLLLAALVLPFFSFLYYASIVSICIALLTNKYELFLRIVARFLLMLFFIFLLI